MTTDKTPKGWAAAGKAAKDLAGQDRAVREQADLERERSHSGWVPLADITARPHGDTRQTAPYHVLDLAESIAALGLLEPLVIDRKFRLLAGAHRWVAAQLLAIADPEERVARWAGIAAIAWPCSDPTVEQLATFERIRSLPASVQPAKVPVRIVDVDAEAEGERAFAIEVAENEKRRDYTKVEVEALAERLSKAGYRISRGKPKAGERALGPALAVIIGKSERTVRRILTDESESPLAQKPASPEGKAKRKIEEVIKILKNDTFYEPCVRELQKIIITLNKGK
jgi:ParB family transcriptional regulator, chromosome partitioning protein